MCSESLGAITWWISITIITAGVSIGFVIALARETTHTFIYVILGVLNLMVIGLGFYVLFTRMYPDQLAARLKWFQAALGSSVIACLVTGFISLEVKSRSGNHWLDLSGILVLEYAVCFGVLQLIFLVIQIFFARRFDSLHDYDDEAIRLFDYFPLCGSTSHSSREEREVMTTGANKRHPY